MQDVSSNFSCTSLHLKTEKVSESFIYFSLYLTRICYFVTNVVTEFFYKQSYFTSPSSVSKIELERIRELQFHNVFEAPFERAVTFSNNVLLSLYQRLPT